MKNNFTHRLTALLLGGFLFALGINAEEKVYQLPNPDFSQWEKGFDKDGKETIYDEPVGWHSFGTGTGSKLSTALSTVKNWAKKGNDGSTPYVNIFAGGLNLGIIKVVANGNLTTGIINAGSTTATNASNYNYTPLKEIGVGADNFRPKLNGRPDAIELNYWHIPKKKTDVARIAAWVHNGEVEYRDPVPKGDLDTRNSYTVASAVTALIANNGFESIIIPFDYETYATYANSPEYILITLTSNETQGGGSIGDELRVNGLKFVYYSTLADLKVNGTPVQGFDENTFEYQMAGEAPGLASITADAKSPWATVSNVSQQETDNKIIFSVTVEGNDFEVSGNQTTYKLIYTKGEEVDGEEVDVTPIIGAYVGELTIDMNAEGETNEENVFKESSSVLLSNDGNGKIGLHIQDFTFAGMPLGNIDIANIVVTKNTIIRSSDVYEFVSDKVQLSFFEGMIVADVKANGSVTNNQLSASIDVDWMIDEETTISIPVIFSGILDSEVGVTIDKPENNVEVYAIGSDIYVSGFVGTVNVYNLSGVKAYSEKVNGSVNFTLDKGLYLIQTNEKVSKVIVK